MSATTLILLLLVLACPISMFFMHRGGGHSHGSHDDSQHQATGSDTGTAAGNSRQAHGGCGHAGHGGSRHEHTKSGTPA
jgi:hypothetical protein